MPADQTLAASPFVQFADWMAEAEKAEPKDPNAMIVATATPDGKPSARAILLKDFDDRGFVFYTNKESRKADELAANANVFLLFYWKSLGRQIRIEGTVESVTDAEADDYYATRPRISRLGAWASQQSRPLPERAVLEDRLADAELQYPDHDIPRPATACCRFYSNFGRTCRIVCTTGRSIAAPRTAPGNSRSCSRKRPARPLAPQACTALSATRL